MGEFIETGRDFMGRAQASGVLNLNKPSGWSSRKVVDLVEWCLGPVRAGHSGTLDPLASGVLVVCVGPATRLIEYVQRMRKEYRATVRLGATSDTDDAEGEVREVAGGAVPDLAEVQAVLPQFRGEILQTPPRYSAVRVKGRRAYDLARAGQEAELAPRRVTVYGLELIGYEYPRLELRIECGSGTYIRSLARDVGEALGTGGLLEALVRTKVGRFELAGAVDAETLDREKALDHLLPALECVADLPRVEITGEQLSEIANGRAIAVEPTAMETTTAGGEVTLVLEAGDLVGIAEYDAPARLLRPHRVFLPSKGS